MADVGVERTALQRTQRWCLAGLGVLLVVLLGTGLWLVFRYQPSGTFEAAHPQSWLRVTHRVASIAFLFAALVTFGISIAVSYERRLRPGIPAWVVGLVLFLGVATASISGYLLPWDQLALKAVRANVSIRGFGFLFGESEVRFALVGSVEVALSTMRRWFLYHVALFPVALVVLGSVLWRVTRRRRLLPPEPAPEPGPDDEPSAAPPS